MAQVFFPGADEGFGAADHDVVAVALDAKDAVPLGEREGHHAGDRLRVHLDRIDVEVGLAGLAGEPLGEGLEVEDLAALEIVQTRRDDLLQRVQSGIGAAQGGSEEVVALLGTEAGDLDQTLDDVGAGQEFVVERSRGVFHAIAGHIAGGFVTQYSGG